MCLVNSADFDLSKDHSMNCVGPSEELVYNEEAFKFCEKIVETETIFCPCKYDLKF
jgi:hypothetical protein